MGIWGRCFRVGRCDAHLLLQEARELAQAAAFHLVSIFLLLGLRLELCLHEVKLSDRRRGIQLFEQSASGLENLRREFRHAWM